MLGGEFQQKEDFMSRAIMNAQIEAEQERAEAALEQLPTERQVAILAGDEPTPGPWHVSEFQKDGLKGFHIQTLEGAVVAEIFPQPHLVHVRKANAEFIASAPDMQKTIAALRRDLASAKDYIKFMHEAMDSLGVRDEVDQEMINLEDAETPLI